MKAKTEQYKEEYMWLAVTMDRYELPIHCGESAAILSRALGLTRAAVSKAVYTKGQGNQKGYKIVKVLLEREEDIGEVD